MMRNDGEQAGEDWVARWDVATDAIEYVNTATQLVVPTVSDAQISDALACTPDAPLPWVKQWNAFDDAVVFVNALTKETVGTLDDVAAKVELAAFPEPGKPFFPLASLSQLSQRLIIYASFSDHRRVLPYQSRKRCKWCGT